MSVFLSFPIHSHFRGVGLKDIPCHSPRISSILNLIRGTAAPASHQESAWKNSQISNRIASNRLFQSGFLFHSKSSNGDLFENNQNTPKWRLIQQNPHFSRCTVQQSGEPCGGNDGDLTPSRKPWSGFGSIAQTDWGIWGD